ncbi:MAG TPA: D-alanyl-D-alanine endopeptidase [Burkholderiales bacterium]|nr:D-alanyl-D-alanine endopeptidase [Burkholderiales bacterium]
MQSEPRTLHRLEKIVVLFALAAALALTIGFAQAAGGKRSKAHHPDEDGDPLALRSSVALVQDANSGEIVFQKGIGAVLPIASITKLMTALVMVEAKLDLSQRVALSSDDQDLLKGTRSRLKPGTVLTRDELLLLALMASENRAAAALARTYPGGTEAFVKAMNAKAAVLGMYDTRFTDATGLSPANVSSARDLARLVQAAHQHPLIAQYSTRESATITALGRQVAYRNTNGLVRSNTWEIGLSKTGFISEAGRCLVMRVRLASRDLVVVLLDSWGRYSRIGDANRIRKWLETSVAAPRS